jgi:hypothetical protein
MEAFSAAEARFGNWSGEVVAIGQINSLFEPINLPLWKNAGQTGLNPLISLPMLRARDYTADALDIAAELHGMSFRSLGAN